MLRIKCLLLCSKSSFRPKETRGVSRNYTPRKKFFFFTTVVPSWSDFDFVNRSLVSIIPPIFLLQCSVIPFQLRRPSGPFVYLSSHSLRLLLSYFYSNFPNFVEVVKTSRNPTKFRTSWSFSWTFLTPLNTHILLLYDSENIYFTSSRF